MKISSLYPAFLFAAFSLTPLVSKAQTKATVTEQMQSMATYPYSDPNPVAKPESSIYPYFLFDGYSSKSQQKEWKVVTLENEYVRVTIFPEIGGKLWGAFDKINKKEFLYTNDAVKFRNIAMRGPWTSGGIEFNFGIIGHEPTTSSPVDYLTRENEDGSVSCFVGSYDLVTRNYWTVEIRVPKDKAYFTTQSTLYNTSSLDQPYYQWMNAAFPAQNNPEFTYPGNTWIGHDGSAHSFPTDDGREINWYEKNNFEGSKSYHVMGHLSNFFGVYWHDTEFGSIHHSNYDAKLGQKIFLWSLARDGAIWENLLTDNHKQYIELQSGRMYNQPQVNSGFTPFKNNAITAQTTDRWLEYWFPVSGTKGVKAVSPLGALNVLRNGSDIQLIFSPLDTFSKAMKIYNGKELVNTIDLNVKTLNTWTKTLTGSGIAEGQLKVVIGDQELVYSENKADFELSRPKTLPADFDWESANGLYIKGLQYMNSKYYKEAEDYLKKSIEKDKYFSLALNRLASLYIHQAKYTEALSFLNTVLSLDAYDEEGNYLYGMCNLALGNITDAKDGFSLASRSNEYRTAAYEKLAEIYYKEGNVAQAKNYLCMSLQYNSMNLSALQLSSVIARTQKSGCKDAAAEMVKIAPLYPASRYEAAKTGLSTLDAFVSAEICEMPQETFMELASCYEAIGCYDEAIELLDMAKTSPLAMVRKAYVQHEQGKDAAAKETLAQAMTMSADYVFPFRNEDIPALEYAVANSSDWKAKYYLAELLLAKNHKDQALKLLDECNSPAYAPFQLLYAEEHSGADCLAALKKAEAAQPSWRVARALMKYYQSEADYLNLVKTGEKYSKMYPENYTIKLSLARGYEELGNNAAGLKLLNKTSILPYEGASEGYVVYRQTNLLEAINCLAAKNTKKSEYYVNEALKYPENLGVGKPFDEQINSCVENYILAQAYASSDKAKSEAYLQKVAATKTRSLRSSNLLSALVLKSQGKTAEAENIAANWRKQNTPLFQWYEAIYQGDKAKATSIAAGMKTGTKGVAPVPFFTSDVDACLVYRLLK